MIDRKHRHRPRLPTPPMNDEALAEKYHKEVSEMLRQSREIHDMTLSSQRRLTFAFSCLVPKQLLTHYGFNEHVQSAEGVASNAQAVSKSLDMRDVFDIVHAINVLAMANADVIHVFTSFSGHVNKFSVHANATDTCYQETNHHIRLLNEDVWLDDEGPLEKLLSIESQLTELIIEAREEAEANEELVPCNTQQ